MTANTSLLSLILPLCMVAPNRKIANTNLFTTTLVMSNPAESKDVSKDIQIDAPRNRSTIASTNSSIESSVLSKAFSIEYSACMETQSADPNWANQTKDELFKLLYMTPNGGKLNIYGLANNTDSILLSYVGLAYNIHPQVLPINSSISSLSYKEL